MYTQKYIINSVQKYKSNQLTKPKNTFPILCVGNEKD